MSSVVFCVLRERVDHLYLPTIPCIHLARLGHPVTIADITISINHPVVTGLFHSSALVALMPRSAAKSGTAMHVERVETSNGHCMSFRELCNRSRLGALGQCKSACKSRQESMAFS
jgi:hypothetical protein